MGEYRRCRHRSIKIQTLTGVMKPASRQEQVFLLYHFSLPLQSSVLSIIRNKKEKSRELFGVDTSFIQVSWNFYDQCRTSVNIEVLEL